MFVWEWMESGLWIQSERVCQRRAAKSVCSVDLSEIPLRFPCIYNAVEAARW